MNSEKYEIILDVKHLNFHYEKNHVLDDVNMQIYKNRITAIYGISGSGKTTLLNILSLLFRELSSYKISGEVLFRDQNILDLDKDFWKIRRKIIYIAQTPNPLHKSIWKNMTFPLKIHGIKDPAIIEEKVIAALKDVNLYEEVKDRLNTSALDLSGGQKQKLCLARALVLCPDILLMDEPTSSLDSINKEVLEDLIIKLGKKNTIIFVSHDMKQIRKIADDIYQCDDKKYRLIERVVD